MSQRKQFGGKSGIAAVLILAAAARVFGDPTTQPAILPSTQPSAAAVMADMDRAYAGLSSAQFDGHIAGHFVVAGQPHNEDASFTSSFAAPNQFRHETQNDILLGSTGTKAYSYLNKRQEFQAVDSPKARAASSDWPSAITVILEKQNPSLLLAMSTSASTELNGISKKVSLDAPTVIDGVSYLTLRFAADRGSVTMLVDPATHLLHEAKFDLRKQLESAGTADVQEATVTIDYTKVAADAPMAQNQFAWTAPAGAILTTATNAIVAGDDDLSPDLKGMIGKIAPDFTLKNLDGKDTKLSDLKGSVVIVDFWATWCGPCVHALPHVDELYKAKQGDGLKVLAVNLQEEHDKVATFVKDKGWSFPVVLDSDAAVASNYHAEAIPETVIVGKDGTVKQVFVGGGHEDDIKTLVEKELK